jgi:hypothetical protein
MTTKNLSELLLSIGCLDDVIETMVDSKSKDQLKEISLRMAKALEPEIKKSLPTNSITP